MRIESVTAQAFGPFVDKTLKFVPGMTVVYGPNESGKSSWHAALYAALCGMRRGRGRAMKEDEAFEARHRPWNGEAWKVSAIISLGDGRKVELRQDLDSKTGTAYEVYRGRDYSSEIINDGAPDGTVWLGLDRRSFLSTACVKQADIQSVGNDADALQEYMQRAAATAGADETAASALSLIKAFYQENVGKDRRNSTKPLRAAMDRFETAKVELQDAQEAHRSYVTQVAELETFESEAAIAREAAEEARNNLDRARELNARHPQDPAPEHSRQDNMAQQARLAFHSWNSRPHLSTSPAQAQRNSVGN